MTASDPRDRARKLLGLWRGAVGGEKSKARGALIRTLEAAGLTLRDLEISLPASRDPEDSLTVREADSLIAALDGDASERDAALSRLADLSGLNVPEREQVLRYLDIGRLVSSRAEGWVQGQSDAEISAQVLSQAGGQLSEAELARAPGDSLADAARDLALLRAALLVRPERTLKAEDEFEAAFIAALAAAISNVPASTHGPDAGGQYRVSAHLSADELSRVRARLAREASGLRRELLRAARIYGREMGQQKL
ncbi:hypothetical protein [Deinococcus sp.]|uniref:hypothetical protein n=1 Tax=Deinococcus sp. TaxID=47478 RepID=UPI0025DDFB49|nr:hypothetical protein [Deinococcus sp.]